MRNIARNQRRADAFGFERANLLVERADRDALFIVEHWAVNRAG